MKKTIIILSFILFIAEMSWAFPNEYGPFENMENIHEHPIQDCILINKIAGSENHSYIYSKSLDSPIFIHLIVQNGDELSIKMTEQSGNLLLPETSIPGNLLTIDSLFWSDLNNDGKDDFIAQTWSGGSGLAALRGYFSIIISSSNSYNVIPITTMSPENNCFVDLSNNNKCQFVHTLFVEGERGKDGKRHNYWVYNLFEFQGNDIVLSNDIDSNFPKWIMYTYNPNHKATDQLTEKQKERIMQLELQPYNNIKEKITN